jgi:predicted dehydrogenase
MAIEPVSRRTFVGTAAATVAAASMARGASPANEKVRIGIIGAGNRGGGVLDSFLKREDVDCVFVCDVDDKHAETTAARVKDAKKNTPKTCRDYRELLDTKELDAVLIATPDHWHALPAVHAVMAGKDVYVEKPVAHNVAEGQAMLKAARKYDKVMAVGTQQRSTPHFIEAVEAVRSGAIGKVFWAQTWNFENISPAGMGKEPDGEAPAYVDYDRWLGPAPKRPFNRDRFHLLFRWYFDYAGGMMSDWGVHLNDIVLWALDSKGPKSVYTAGGILTTDDNRDTPDTLQVVYELDGGASLTYSMRKGNGLSFQGRGYGILFCGTDGSLVLDRSGYEIIPDQISEPYGIKSVYGDRPHRTIKLEPKTVKGGQDGTSLHVNNFVECLRSREKPAADIEIAHRSTNTCHLGNIAYMTKRKLTWDAKTESFPGDSEANALLSREARKGYELPQV